MGSVVLPHSQDVVEAASKAEADVTGQETVTARVAQTLRIESSEGSERVQSNERISWLDCKARYPSAVDDILTANRYAVEIYLPVPRCERTQVIVSRQMFAVSDGDTLFIAIKGTTGYLSELRAAADVSAVGFHGAEAPRGFTDFARKLETALLASACTRDLDSAVKLVVTGHSLGAAMACYLGVMLKDNPRFARKEVIVVSFALPSIVLNKDKIGIFGMLGREVKHFTINNPNDPFTTLLKKVDESSREGGAVQWLCQNAIPGFRQVENNDKILEGFKTPNTASIVADAPGGLGSEHHICRYVLPENSHLFQEVRSKLGQAAREAYQRRGKAAAEFVTGQIEPFVQRSAAPAVAGTSVETESKRRQPSYPAKPDDRKGIDHVEGSDSNDDVHFW